MKTIKTLALFCGALVGISSSANSQGFINLDFERARIRNAQPAGGFLDWSLAAPGWSHSQGGDTETIFWGSHHVGATQYFLLMDSTSPEYAPNTQLAGRYSLAFTSGVEYFNPITGIGPWVNAFISQTGTIPAGTRSLQMLVTGPFEVFVGGVNIPMYSLGGTSFGGDISGFGGSTAEIRIRNTANIAANNRFTPTIVDNIAFSTAAVPEPSSLALLISGLMVFIGYKRKKHTV